MQTLKERAQHVMRKGSIEDYENFVQEIANAPTPEPFGYFKAEPFGWTDCAETDDGAIALYELPPAPSVPVEPMENIALNEWLDKTEWVQKQLNTFPVSSLGMHRADVMRLEIDRLRKLLSAAPTPAEAQSDVARDARLQVESEFAALLPGVAYMDVPDGGSPTVQEQVKRMALDAARYRWLLKQAWFQQAADRFDFTDGGLQIRFEKCMGDFIDAAMSEKGDA